MICNILIFTYLGPIEQRASFVSAQISRYLRFLVLAFCPIRSKLSHKFMLLQITMKPPDFQL